MIRFLFQLAVLFTLVTANVHGQTYQQLINQADSLYQARDYHKSNEKYQRAFTLEKKNKNDLYNAACAAALAGDTNNSFAFLELAFNNGWTNIEHLKTDSDLNGLHTDSRWATFVSKMQNKIDVLEANYDKPLQKELLAIFDDDQGIRHEYSAAVEKLGRDHPTVDSLVKIALHNDSLNLVKVTKILDEKGWVGADKVGERANLTLFLVIQHADLKTQEKYLPMIHDAVKKGNASADNLALLEDRVALRQSRKQIYGSQIFRHPQTDQPYVAPLDDPDNVDKRRAAVGLDPLADYVKNWNIVWDVEKYKKQLPQYEELQE